MFEPLQLNTRNKWQNFVFQKLKTVKTLGKQSFVSSTANVSVSDVCSYNKSKQNAVPSYLSTFGFKIELRVYKIYSLHFVRHLGKHLNENEGRNNERNIKSLKICW